MIMLFTRRHVLKPTGWLFFKKGKTMTDQDRKIIEAMQRNGGNFIQKLAAAFTAADSENRGKIKGAFGEEFNRYLVIAEWDAKREVYHD